MARWLAGRNSWQIDGTMAGYHFAKCFSTFTFDQGASLLSHIPPPIEQLTTQLSQTQLSAMLSRALRRSARLPPAAATCAGGSNSSNTTFSSPPEASVSRRRWRSTDADKSSRNFSGLVPSSSDGSWKWQHWGLPQLLVNVPKGETKRTV